MGVVLGTVAYMAPEAALGMLAVDARSDLYAVGLILYELLAGKHPFDATEPVQLFLQQRTMLPPAIAVRSPDVSVPPALEALVLKLLEKDPKDRYQSASELIAALDSVMMATNFEVIPEASLPNRRYASRLRLWRAERSCACRGVSVLDSLIPRDGRFPRWAYVALSPWRRFSLRSRSPCSRCGPRIRRSPTRVLPRRLSPPAESGDSR